MLFIHFETLNSNRKKIILIVRYISAYHMIKIEYYLGKDISYEHPTSYIRKDMY